MASKPHPILSDIEGFFLRWLAAVALVFGTYNPSKFNYIAWLRHMNMEQLPYLIFTGLLILIGFAIFFRATWHSIGIWGISLLILLFGSAIWSLSHLGVIDLSNHGVLTYVVLFTLATVMTIGLDWSIIRRQISGQIDVED